MAAMMLRSLVAALLVLLAACAAPAPPRQPAASPMPASADEAYRMALRLQNGNGVPRDEGRAAALLARAAGQGHDAAQFALAEAYAQGQGVGREPAWATLWYARAAQRGHVEAQYRLALAHIAGAGAPVDLIEAYKWLSIAVAAGHRTAAREREVLAGRMIREEMLPAARTAAAWKPPRAAAADEEPLVRFVQFALRELGYEPGAVDGVLGRRTRRAMLAFAGHEGLASNDALSAGLVARLRARLAAINSAALDRKG